MMQSSVDWLVSKLPQRMLNYLKEEIEQAKQMHKEEIKDAHGEEQSKLQDDGSWKRQTADQYYNETYNK